MPTTAESPGLLAENKVLYAKRAAKRAAAKEAKERGVTLPPERRTSDRPRRRGSKRSTATSSDPTKGDEQETLTPNGVTDTAAQWFAKMKPRHSSARRSVVHDLLETRLKHAETLVTKPWDGLVARRARSGRRARASTRSASRSTSTRGRTRSSSTPTTRMGPCTSLLPRARRSATSSTARSSSSTRRRTRRPRSGRGSGARPDECESMRATTCSSTPQTR